MTNEQKAKAYDEALERARKQRDDYQKELDKTDKNSQLAGLLCVGISAIDMVFPNLTESEEDERMLTDISWAIRHCAYDDKKKERVMKWFNDDYRKSLRPSWKPSKEQMRALNKAIPVCMVVVGRDAVAPLESLCEQLEKLM